LLLICRGCPRSFKNQKQFDRHECNKPDGRMHKAARTDPGLATEPAAAAGPASPPASTADGEQGNVDGQRFVLPPSSLTAEEADAAARVLQQVLPYAELPDWLAGVQVEDNEGPDEARQQAAAFVQQHLDQTGLQCSPMELDMIAGLIASRLGEQTLPQCLLMRCLCLLLAEHHGASCSFSCSNACNLHRCSMPGVAGCQAGPAL